MTGRLLLRERTSGLDALVALNRPVYLAHAALVDAVRAELGAEHASLFARPVAEGGDLLWYTDVLGDARAWNLLPEPASVGIELKRRQMGEALHGLVERLARAGPNARQGNLSQLVNAALVVPGPEHIFLVGDQPVVTFWGFSRRGNPGIDPFIAVIPRLPRALPARPRSNRCWRSAAIALTLLLLLLLLLLLYTHLWAPGSRLESLPVPPLPALVSPPPLPVPSPLPAQSVIPSPPPPPIATVPAPPSGSKLMLPPTFEDLSFMKGHWDARTSLLWGNPSHNEAVSLSMAFEKNGLGTLSVHRAGRSETCSSADDVTVRDTHLVLQTRYPPRCPDGTSMTNLRITCTRQSDGSALCHGINLPSGQPFSTTIARAE